MRAGVLRHACALLCLGAVLGAAGCAVDALARHSAASGVVVVWTHEPGALLTALSGADARLVNVWLSGHLVQLHVEALRDFRPPRPAAALTLHLPQAAVVLAGCG